MTRNEQGEAEESPERGAAVREADRLRSALGDRFAFEREIGIGGAAAVYLGEDLRHPVTTLVLCLEKTPPSRLFGIPQNTCRSLNHADGQ
jgi:hypothetical protein